MLDAAIKNAGPAFQAVVGKFKFLNELVKLVSKKVCVALDDRCESLIV